MEVVAAGIILPWRAHVGDGEWSGVVTEKVQGYRCKDKWRGKKKRGPGTADGVEEMRRRTEQ
jgi:hypothetical protein